jgi:hypothetical protein
LAGVDVEDLAKTSALQEMPRMRTGRLQDIVRRCVGDDGASLILAIETE